MTLEIFLWGFAAVNVITFSVAAWDKLMAKRNGWRIPEKTLFLLAAVGGAAGLLLAMYTVRHKTRKKTFKYGVPLILLLQVGIAYTLAQQGFFIV